MILIKTVFKNTSILLFAIPFGEGKILFMSIEIKWMSAREFILYPDIYLPTMRMLTQILDLR